MFSYSLWYSIIFVFCNYNEKTKSGYFEDDLAKVALTIYTLKPDTTPVYFFGIKQHYMTLDMLKKENYDIIDTLYRSRTDNITLTLFDTDLSTKELVNSYNNYFFIGRHMYVGDNGVDCSLKYNPAITIVESTQDMVLEPSRFMENSNGLKLFYKN